MTTEIIISIISLVLSTFCSILTVLINVKISKINNLEAEHKYQKHITKFELSFKDEEWLFNLMESDEFQNYDKKSRRLIHKWWLEYSKAYLPEKLKVKLLNSRNFNGLLFSCPPPELAPPPETELIEDQCNVEKED